MRSQNCRKTVVGQQACKRRTEQVHKRLYKWSLDFMSASAAAASGLQHDRQLSYRSQRRSRSDGELVMADCWLGEKYDNWVW